MYDFLFYCFYSAMYKKDKHQKTAPQRAVEMLTVTVFALILSLYPLYFISVGKSAKNVISYSNITIYIICLTMLLSIYFINHSIFIRDEKYSSVVDKFNNRYTSVQRVVLGIFAVILFFGSIFGFLTLGRIIPV